MNCRVVVIVAALVALFGVVGVQSMTAPPLITLCPAPNYRSWWGQLPRTEGLMSDWVDQATRTSNDPSTACYALTQPTDHPCPWRGDCASPSIPTSGNFTRHDMGKE
jgi:hypothetical protein